MNKLFFILSFFISVIANAQIIYFGSASTPADSPTATNTATTTSVTPPGSMTTGDLVIMYAYQRGASTTFSISATGGQSWTSETAHQSSTAILSARVFWCRYNGTWSADPSVLFSVGTNTNVIMHVFRPTSTSYQWALETGMTGVGASDMQVLTSFSATSPVSQPLSSYNINTHASTVSICIWSTDDDNTWGAVSGSGWTDAGSAQYRNTSGSDVSSSFAYSIRTTTGTVNSASKTEATLGNDPGIRGGYVFYEFIPTFNKGAFFNIF
jgi:hypothetical protein